MAEINLAPGTEYIVLSRKRQRRVYGIAFMLVLLVAVIWGGLYIVRQRLVSEKRDIDNRISVIQAEITRLDSQAQRVELFENRLLSIDSLLANHINWDPFLTDLERLLPSPAVINLLQVNVADGSVGLSGATPDIDQVAQTLASLVTSPERETIFQSAVIDSVIRTQVESPEGEVVSITYEFNVDLTFDSNVLTNGQ